MAIPTDLVRPLSPVSPVLGMTAIGNIDLGHGMTGDVSNPTRPDIRQSLHHMR
jgi:hypothetical protein